MKKNFLRNISIALVAIVLGLTSSNFSAKAASTKYISYIRVSAEGHYMKDGNAGHIIPWGPYFSEVQAYVGNTNVALNGQVFGNGNNNTEYLHWGNLVTDGLTYGESQRNYAYYNDLGEMFPPDISEHNIIVQLNGIEEPVDTIKVCVDGIINKVEVADYSGNEWTTVYDKKVNTPVNNDGYQIIKLG